jgi:hypothetical protein
LVAFADDILVKSYNTEEIEQCVRAFEEIRKVFNLSLNVRKSCIMTENPKFTHLTEIAGIPTVKSTKYLGMKISLDQNKMIRNTRYMIINRTAYFRA